MMRKRSAIGHSGLPFNCPHDDDIVDTILQISQESLRTSAPRIVDLGCGRGEVLCRAVEMGGENAVGIGVDSDVTMLSQIRTPSRGTISTIEMDLENWITNSLKDNVQFDVIMCIGALPSERQREVITDLVRLLCPNGTLVVGELVWIVPEPGVDFVSYSGITSCAYMKAEELRKYLSSVGFEVQYEISQRLERYESNLLKNVENWAITNAEDPDCMKILEVSRNWHAFGVRCAWDTWEFATLVGRATSTSST